jgi:drug/metabolite transporter (DMT)-like permease
MSKSRAAAALSQSPAADPRQRLVGIGLMCAALLCFSCLDTSAKFVGHTIHPLMTVWWRYTASVALVALVINPSTTPGVLRTTRPWLQAIRSLLLFLSTALNFIALRYLQLAETMSIAFSTPLIVALVAGPLLGEWVGLRRLAAILIGLVGVLVITRPGLGTTHPAALLSVASAFAYAFYAIMTRLLASSDSARTTMVYSGLAGVLVMTPLLPWVWSAPSSPLIWALLVGTGVFGAIGHWLLILAHARAPAAILSPFIYTQIIWMLALGYFVFGDWPDTLTLIGAAIVIASGLYLITRERPRPAARTKA